MLLDNWPPITAVLLKVFPPTLESKRQDSGMCISTYTQHSIISAASES